MNMAVLNSEVASIVVHASAGAKSLDENSQRAPPILALDLTEQRAATPVMLHASSDDKYAEDSHADSQRSSGRSRTPTRRLAESNLKDSTRLIVFDTMYRRPQRAGRLPWGAHQVIEEVKAKVARAIR